MNKRMIELTFLLALVSPLAGQTTYYGAEWWSNDKFYGSATTENDDGTTSSEIEITGPGGSSGLQIDCQWFSSTVETSLLATTKGDYDWEKWFKVPGWVEEILSTGQVAYPKTNYDFDSVHVPSNLCVYKVNCPGLTGGESAPLCPTGSGFGLINLFEVNGNPSCQTNLNTVHTAVKTPFGPWVCVSKDQVTQAGADVSCQHGL